MYGLKLVFRYFFIVFFFRLCFYWVTLFFNYELVGFLPLVLFYYGWNYFSFSNDIGLLRLFFFLSLLLPFFFLMCYDVSSPKHICTHFLSQKLGRKVPMHILIPFFISHYWFRIIDYFLGYTRIIFGG